MKIVFPFKEFCQIPRVSKFILYLCYFCISSQFFKNSDKSLSTYYAKPIGHFSQDMWQIPLSCKKFFFQTYTVECSFLSHRIIRVVIAWSVWQCMTYRRYNSANEYRSAAVEVKQVDIHLEVAMDIN